MEEAKKIMAAMKARGAAVPIPTDVVVAKELSPGFDHRALRSLLAKAGNPAEAAFVGHEPDLGSLAAALLGLPEAFGLRKGAVLAMTVHPYFAGLSAFVGAGLILLSTTRNEELTNGLIRMGIKKERVIKIQTGHKIP